MTPIIELVKNSWGVFVKIWKNYLALISIMFVGIVGVAAVSFGPVLAKLITTTSNPDEVAKALVGKGWPFLAIFFLLLIVFASIMGLAINKLIYSSSEGQIVSIKDSLSYGVNNFPGYFWVSILTAIVVIVGFILLVIPGFYAVIALSFVPVVFIIEEKRGVAVLKRSRELVKGNFWPVTGRLVVLFLSITIISEIVKNIPLLSLVVNFILSPISIAYLYFLYKDLSKK